MAALNAEKEAGLAVLRREPESQTWQVEEPWQGPLARHLAAVSRVQFLRNSVVHAVVGQTSALGTCEISIYDISMTPLQPIAAFRRHTELVADVCTLSPQTFASVSYDGTALLWDIRTTSPIAEAQFPGEAPRGLCSVTAAGSSLLLCGSLAGDIVAFDPRALGRALARPPSVKGAVVRLQGWLDGGNGSAATVAICSSEEGLCSLRLGPGTDEQVRPSRYKTGADGSDNGDSPVQLFYDVARSQGGAILAAGDHGVVRYRCETK